MIKAPKIRTAKERLGNLGGLKSIKSPSKSLPKAKVKPLKLREGGEAAVSMTRSTDRGPRTNVLSDSKLSALDLMKGMKAGEAPKTQDTARAQLDDVLRQLKLKERSVQSAMKGLGRDTFGAATLEQPTLTQSSLTKRRFAEGGDVSRETMSPEEQPVTEESSASRVLKQLMEPVREGAKGYFGFDPTDATNPTEAFRTGQALSNMPGVGAPGAIAAGAVGLGSRALGKAAEASKKVGDLFVDTPQFKKWFGESRVVGKGGKPLVVYHGTSAKDDFSVFSEQSHFGTAVAANQRAKDRPEGPARVYPVYLSVRNPLRVSDAEASDEATLLNAIKRGKYKDIDLNTANQKGAIEALKEAGYDGLVYKNNMEDRGKDSWVAFSPTQIKSAIGNEGTFDPTSKVVTKAEGGEVNKHDAFIAQNMQTGGEVSSPEEQPVTEESSASKALKRLIEPVREGARGFLGMEPTEPMNPTESYKALQALGNMPGPMMAKGAVKAAMQVPGLLEGITTSIFIGPRAAQWNKATNATARAMEKADIPAEEIWRQTGNFKGPDGQWRQEISDVGARHNQAVTQGPASMVLKHPELYQAYPDLKQVMVQSDPYEIKSSYTGFGQPGAELIRLGTAGGKTENVKGLLHEMSHAIQFREGFGKGGSKTTAFANPEAVALYKSLRKQYSIPMSIEQFAKDGWQTDSVTPEITKAYKGYVDYVKKNADRAAQDRAADLYYQRLLGEAEARAVEGRRTYTPEQRLEVFPAQSYRYHDTGKPIPLSDLIIKRKEGGPVNKHDAFIKAKA